MQLKYEHLDYQKQAIDSIVDLFQGEITHHQDDFSLSDKDNMRVIANELSLSKDDIFNNLKISKRKISFLYLINWIICILV